ncbi:MULTISPECIES: hypothetical protein [unclassified Luteimonas]|uniref:hypothetical protein n=1 Tax=unclassified Luteimonas TaxID=2629088 RepID=UPI0015FEBB42|nr:MULTISPECIES: hypothetical protein [unclassified Luteimonas]MBB1471766.1 hypothetical protein [Luteimonas sp. MC1782]MBB6599491.1 hypothetical protein [Luteimonas sp. MC1825]QOC87190.1 hypothetical protein IDM46_07800 [Luteimonas sp. MC1825]
MSWLALMAVIVALYLLFKVVGVVMKIALWIVVVVAAYWLLAPLLGWPELAEVVHVLGP